MEFYTDLTCLQIIIIYISEIIMLIETDNLIKTDNFNEFSSMQFAHFTFIIKIVHVK